MPSGLFNWQKTAAANATADSSINWAEGQAPSSVNDSARAMMARIAEARDDAAGAITTAGTSTAYTAATNQVFTSLTLMDKKAIMIVPHATSGASPTLNVDGLGAKPLRCATGAALSAGAFAAGTPYSVTYYHAAGEFLCDGAGIADGAISTANLAAQAVTAAKIANNTITSAQIMAGAITAAAVSPSFFPVSTSMINGIITQSVSAGSITFNVKTLAGADPSAADPTTFLFRDATIGAGDYLVRSVTAPLSITIASTKAIGVLTAVPARIWLMAIDAAGTVELAVFNAAAFTAGTPVGVANVFPLQAWGITTTQAISGGAAAGIAYSNTVRSSVAYVPIAYAAWEAGNTMTAGTWTAPSRLQLFQPGSSPLPGQALQQVWAPTGAMATGTTGIPHDNTIPQQTEGDQYMSASVTPSSSANVLMVSANGHFSEAGGTISIIMALFQDANANSLATSMSSPGAATVMTRVGLDYQLQAGTLSATTFKIRAGANTGPTLTFNGESGAQFYGGSLNSGIRIAELMT